MRLDERHLARAVSRCCVGAAVAVKHIYIDPGYTGGSPNGAYATPFKTGQAWTIGTGAGSTETGHECVIHYKRGYVYGSPDRTSGAFWFNNLQANGYIRIEPYGDAELAPTLCSGWHIKPGAEAWSYLGAGVWKLAFARDWSASVSSPSRMRLFAGGGVTGAAVGFNALGTGYTIGTPLARAFASHMAATTNDAMAMAELHAPTGLGNYRDWLCTVEVSPGPKQAYLYVYTGSATVDPATYYGGLVLTGNTGTKESLGGHGARYGIIVSDSTNISISGLTSVFAGEAGGVLGNGVATSRNVVISNSTFLACGSGAKISGAVLASAADGCGLVDCLVDGYHGPSEEPNWQNKSDSEYDWLHSVLDLVSIGTYATDCYAERVTALRAGHSSFAIGGYQASDGPVVNARLADCYANNDGTKWGYCLGIGPQGIGNVATVTRFRGEKSQNFIHKTGYGVLDIYDSVFSDGRKPYPAYDGGYPLDANNPANTIPAVNVFSSSVNPTTNAGAITGTRCTFSRPYGYMLTCYTNNYDALPSGVMEFKDTLFVDNGPELNDQAARNLNMTRGMTPGASINVRNSGANAGIIDFSNCYYWTGSAGQPRVFDAYNDATPPYVTVNTFAASTKISGTLYEVDPKTDSAGYPLAGSPLIGGALTNGMTRDAAGVYRDVMSAIGAYEYVTARPTRTLP